MTIVQPPMSCFASCRLRHEVRILLTVAEGVSGWMGGARGIRVQYTTMRSAAVNRSTMRLREIGVIAESTLAGSMVYKSIMV